MAITHHFKGSTDSYGYGYFAYIEEGQLVIGENWPREGGVTYRGPYEHAGVFLYELKDKAEKLYNSIQAYYSKQGCTDPNAELKEKLGFEESTKTILFKVRLHMNNRAVHNVKVRGRFQADVIKKLTPATNEILTLQTNNGNIFAVYSGNISAIEFVEG